MRRTVQPEDARRSSKLDPRDFLEMQLAKKADIAKPPLALELASKRRRSGARFAFGRQLHRLIVVDETDTTTKLTGPRGRCLKGKRAKAPFGCWKIPTFIAGLQRVTTGPSMGDGAPKRNHRNGRFK